MGRQSADLGRSSRESVSILTPVFPQDYCGSNPGTFRILVGNEGCGYPSLKCRRRVTILVEGGEIELFDGEVSVGLSLHPHAPPLADEEHMPSVRPERVWMERRAASGEMR